MARKDFKKSTAELFISAAETNEQEPVKRDPVQDELPDGLPEGFVVPKGYRLQREVKSKRVQLLVRPATKEAIQKSAAAQGLSMNDLVNQILDEYAERQGLL